MNNQNGEDLLNKVKRLQAELDELKKPVLDHLYDNRPIAEIFRECGWKYPEDEVGQKEVLERFTRIIGYWRQQYSEMFADCMADCKKDRLFRHQSKMLEAVRKKIKNVRKHAQDFMRYKEFEQFAKFAEENRMLLSRAEAAEKERDRLKEAIVAHRSQKADDRCIEDDDRLYAALGDGVSKADMLKNCERFTQNRCEGGGWKTYAELEAENDRLSRSLALREKLEQEGK